MAYKDTGKQVEFISAIGGEPTVIAAGSFEEVTEALAAGRAINEEVEHPRGEAVSPGTRHAMEQLSQGLGEEAVQGLADYESKVQDGIEEQDRRIRGED